MQTVTQADIEANIASEHYFTGWDGINGALAAGNLHQRHADTDTANGQQPPAATPYEATRLMTFCVLVTRNGHTVTGESYCQDPAKFDAETGRQWARNAAVDKLWPMVVYARRGEAAAAAVDPEAAADVQDAS